MRCPPEESRPTICGEFEGWLLPAAVLCIKIRPKRSLWRSGGEENEDFLEEGNCGDGMVLALIDTDTVRSIGSNRRGDLLQKVMNSRM